MEIEKQNLKVWWSSRVPIIEGSLEVYPVKNVEEAKEKINFLTERDLKNENITDNVGGLWENDEEEEYYDEEGRDIFEIIEEDLNN